jgi:hypothetical protein
MPKATRRVPKRIAGVKLPKELRHQAEAALDLAASPIVSSAIAAALIGGATALADGKSRRDVAKAAGLGAGAAAVKDSEGLKRIALAAGIAGAEILAGLAGLLDEAAKPKPKTKAKTKKTGKRTAAFGARKKV